jgi:hypothetical protein
MSNTTQGPQLSDVLFFEEDREYSRAVVTLLDGSDVDIGTVLGKVTASGNYANFDDTADDGTEDAAAISLAKAAPSGADANHVVLLRHGVVKKGGLIWPSTADASEQTAAIAQLEALGIMVRADV